MPLMFHRITFAHDGAIAPLLENVTAHFPEGWTGIVGSNGAGKTTVLHLAAREHARLMILPLIEAQELQELYEGRRWWSPPG